jgi:hypothetical protein
MRRVCCTAGTVLLSAERNADHDRGDTYSNSNTQPSSHAGRRF